MNLINFTRFEVGATLPTDKHGRQHLLVVAKGTFEIRPDGICLTADEQVPLVYADRFTGEPGLSSISEESDFASFKPMADVVVDGSAYAPGGRPVSVVDVTLEIAAIRKTLRVTGDRVWKESLLGGFRPSAPKLFVQMPIVHERAFGGWDRSPNEEKNHVCERRNLVGVSMFANVRSDAEGKPLPNVEYPDNLMRTSTDRPPPAGFGFVGRNWTPRVVYAGTYGQAWLDEQFPFLPLDFDERYFQGAPEDQVCAHLKGGETVRLTNLHPGGGVLQFRLPIVRMPVGVKYESRRDHADSVLDTVVLRPDRKQVAFTWRARLPLRQKPTLLREVLIGEPSFARRRATETGKRYVDWRSPTEET